MTPDDKKLLAFQVVRTVIAIAFFTWLFFTAVKR